MAKKKNEFSYDAAVIEIRAILDKLESGEVSIDQLLVEVARAEELLQQCQDKLRQIEEKMDEISKEE